MFFVESEFDVILRDGKSDRERLDFIRKSFDSDRLTRPIDLQRKWSHVTGIRLLRKHLIWRRAIVTHTEDKWIFDGEVDREFILSRRKAEHVGRGILDEFVMLHNANDKAILNFARTWGVLEICCHNLPCGHDFSLGVLRVPDPMTPPEKKIEVDAWEWVYRQCPALGFEPLTTWRFLSEQAYALLMISAELERGHLDNEQYWVKLLRNGVAPRRSIGAQRGCIRDVVNCWLKVGRIKPTIDERSSGIVWKGADLFGELAVQIGLATTGSEGQVYCIACGKPYEPKKRIIRGGFNYCPALQCQRKAAAQRARRYRNRKSSGGESARKLPYKGAYGGRTNDPLFS